MQTLPLRTEYVATEMECLDAFLPWVHKPSTCEALCLWWRLWRPALMPEEGEPFAWQKGL